MSVLQRTIRMFVMAALAVAGQVGMADSGYHPFSEPMEFDPDWQFFAPVQSLDMQELGTRQHANHGFFLTYDRMHIGVDRSDVQGATNAIDFAWGNRFDFGWMKSSDDGWLFSAMDVSGPNQYHYVEQYALNQFVTNASGGNGVNGINGPVGTGGSPGLVGTFPFLPVGLRNNIYGQRIYLLRDTVNVGSFASFEANKTWRMEPYRYGGVIEPMIGLRYAFFGDSSYNDNYVTGATAAPQIPTPGLFETVTANETETDNYMLLGQIGFRYTKYVRRWTFANDFKFFGGVVYQNQETAVRSMTLTYPTPPAVGTAATTISNDPLVTSYFGQKNEEATFGFDLKVEGQYKATKYIDLRAGFTMLYFGGGIWRGANPTLAGLNNFQNQNLIMPGFTFGVALNR